VAASCAAVLAVYAAGYWRTRDEARRIDIQAHARRPARPERSTAPLIQPAPIEPASPSAQVHPELPPTNPPSQQVTPAPSATVTAAATAAAVSTTLAPAAATVAAKPPSNAASKAAAATSPPAIVSSQVAPAIPAEPTATAANGAASTLAPAPASTSVSGALAVPSANWRDGTYTGWGTSRHGDIKAQVVIKNGRIVESGIASCETRYPCDVISEIFHQPVERQNPDVDRVSRATESADAYYYGLVDALSQALAQPADQATTPR